MMVCAVTGHRPTRFKFKYNEKHTGCKRLKRRLREQFAALYEQGVRRFYIGGALGVDLWSGEELLRLKEQSEYSSIELIIAIPFDGHDNGWDERSQKRFAALKARAEVIIISSEVGAVGYKKRNQYMVDHADCLVAVYDNARTIRSGTGQTVHTAERKGIPIIFIHPDTGEITYKNIDTEKRLEN